VVSDAKFTSDEKSNYRPTVKRYFPNAKHKTVKGRKACVSGQGEIKIGGRDPLFSINHTLAMLRAHISRLVRKTWSNTKKIDNLVHHLNIYVKYHNTVLT